MKSRRIATQNLLFYRNGLILLSVHSHVRECMYERHPAAYIFPPELHFFPSLVLNLWNAWSDVWRTTHSRIEITIGYNYYKLGQYFRLVFSYFCTQRDPGKREGLFLLTFSYGFLSMLRHNFLDTWRKREDRPAFTERQLHNLSVFTPSFSSIDHTPFGSNWHGISHIFLSSHSCFTHALPGPLFHCKNTHTNTTNAHSFHWITTDRHIISFFFLFTCKKISVSHTHITTCCPLPPKQISCFASSYSSGSFTHTLKRRDKLEIPSHPSSGTSLWVTRLTPSPSYHNCIMLSCMLTKLWQKKFCYIHSSWRYQLKQQTL